MRTDRRRFLIGAAAVGAVGAPLSCRPSTAEEETAPPPQVDEILLRDFRPKSMLAVPETRVSRARFPVIDAHTHVVRVLDRTPRPDAVLQGRTPEERLRRIVQWMDELNIRTMVNLVGGFGSEEFARTTEFLVKPYPGRFVQCVQPTLGKLNEPGYPEWQAEELARAKKMGAVGLKINKTLGLYLREGGFKEDEREPGQEGPLVKIDDRRLFPMWRAAGELDLPVFIHISDPDAFFTPLDRYNERWEELFRNPRAHFFGGDFPTKKELFDARNRVIEAHPDTTFVGLHVATNPENLDEVGRLLDRYPNFHVEVAASLGELGRQPRRTRKFFEDYRDRIMFGTDASPNNPAAPQQDLTPEMYQCYFRCFETLDEYFDYSPAEFPPQGFWNIYGVGLPDEILKDFYHNNAARLLGWETI